MSRSPGRGGSGGGVDPLQQQQLESAVPTLRVMRLQSPELHQPQAGTLDDKSILQTSLCLPDSLAVYVGEKFTAYLGVLNASKLLPIRSLNVTAQLQTPTQRWQLPSQLDRQTNSSGIHVDPGGNVDAIVSHDIEEAGQHILRVEVGYVAADGGSKTFRKFYRFNVVAPLLIKEVTVRSGDSTCYVNLSVEFNSEQVTADNLVVASSEFTPAEGYAAERIGNTCAISYDNQNRRSKGTTGSQLDDTQDENACRPRRMKSAVQLLDQSGLICKGGCFRYLFKIKASSSEALLRGIAAGDLLGRAIFTWRKAMGETGRMSSPPIYCPAVQLPGPMMGMDTPSNFVVHQSGLSVDVAAAAATRISCGGGPVDANDLSRKLPITVEPIDPPPRMHLNVPREVQFLVVNHSAQAMTLQLQFRLSQMTGLAVCGSSFKTVGSVQPNGGSTVVSVRFLPLAAGLLRVQGCCIVDLTTGNEISQPPLFQTYIDQNVAQ